MIDIKDFSYIPELPGCYLFKGENGETIYVGKAKNLKKRVSSYFNKNQEGKTEVLVSMIKKIDFIVTKTETEALILENNLIKKYSPRYNINLKDSKRYAYIRLHDDKFPWIEIARKRAPKGTYFGPFTSGSMRKIIMDTISRNFKILARKASPKLRSIMNEEEYASRVSQAKKILQGNVDELTKELTEIMEYNSKIENFEYALIVKNQIEALNILKERQNMEMSSDIDSNIINYKVVNGEVYLIVFNIRKGVLEEKQSHNFKLVPDFLYGFLSQYYSQNQIPKTIILPEEIDESLKEYLEEISGKSVSIIIPKIGQKKELLDLAYKNIDMTFFAGSERLIELKKLINIEVIPRLIECFDISHLGGTGTVASMVSFKNGLPDKPSYRKFKISSENKDSDDYGAMREVIRRRYSGTLSKTMQNPDLIIVDGGLGQLHVAKEELKKLNKKTPIISIAERFEEIYLGNSSEPIRASRKNKGLQLVQMMRDEAHRFALKYQRKIRTREMFNDEGRI